MRLYTIYNVYADILRDDIKAQKTHSIVDFGTAMINKRKRKRNKRK